MAKETRTTKQKKILNEELLTFKTFFTADELWEKAQKKDKNLGIATVYRFLKSSNDHLHSYYCDRRQIYSTQNNSHCHFICSQCGETSHINIKDIDSIKKNIDGKVCHFQIDIHGICKKCLNKD